MTRWEYRVWAVDEPHKQDDYDILNGFGNDGWESYAVTVRQTHRGTTYVYHFKRMATGPK